MSLETAVLHALAFWFVFYVVNYSTLLRRMRGPLYGRLPEWARTLLRCPLCTSFWVYVGVCAFSGYTPLVLWVPPLVLIIDLVYRKLSV